MISGESQVKHFFARDTHQASTLLQTLGLDNDKTLELLRLGCVYSRKKRLIGDDIIGEGDYVRIHLNPRRFPTQSILWQEIIVRDTEDFIIANKPAGVPVHATLDNAIENVCYQLGCFLGKKLLVTHRLDIPTQGLLVLAKTPDFQTTFNRWLEKRFVEKRYRALVEREPRLGRLVHYMKPTSGGPKILNPMPQEGWLRCELDIESTRPSGNFCEVDLRPITGRTHQIRSQLAAVGSPIVGDRFYGSITPAFSEGFESIALQACYLRFDKFEFELPRPW